VTIDARAITAVVETVPVEYPAYRVVFWRQMEPFPGATEPMSYVVDEWRLTGVNDVLEAQEWAKTISGYEGYSLHVEVPATEPQITLRIFGTSPFQEYEIRSIVK
jgi:hypothetical protein